MHRKRVKEYLLLLVGTFAHQASEDCSSTVSLFA